MRRVVSIFVALTISVVLLSALGWSQTTSGDITGTVSDTSGAVVANATVTALNTATGLKASTTASQTGSYHFANLPIGNYKISGLAAGYSVTAVQVAVELNKTTTVPLVLHIGKVETVIEVSGAADTVDTTSANISSSFSSKLAEELPEAATGSGVLNLSLLAPGVTSGSAMGYGAGPSVGGQRPTNNSFTLEGVDNNSRSTTGPITTVPNDAVAEFTMLQNQFSPEFGHSSGGQFNTVVKSGENTFHGKAYEYFQNRNLNALDPALASQGFTSVPRYDNNRFGGSAGGAIIKDKLFYFGLVEYNPLGSASPSSSSICVPSAAGFAALDAMPGISATNLGVFEQYTKSLPTTPGCGSSPSSQSTTVLGATIPLATVSVASPFWANTFNSVGAIDYNMSGKDQLHGRWIYNRLNELDTSGASLSAFFSTIGVRAHTVSITENHIFSPTLTNELRIGYNRQAQLYPVGNYKFPGLDQFPNLTFDDLASLQIGPNGNYPQSNMQNSYQLSDSVSWTKGRHTLKFGGDVLRTISPSDFVQYLRPEYEYSSLDLYLQDLSPDSTATRGFSNGGYYYGNNWNLSWYANDQFKATRNLTLNLGVRYEYSTLPQGASLQTLNAINNVPGLIMFDKPQMPTKNFMPRIGFAYSPGTSGNTSIRGGFGISYDIVFDNLFQNSLPQEYQYTTDYSLSAQTSKFLQNGGITTAGSAPTDRSNTAELIPNQTKDPYTENWNLGVQHVFNNVWTVEAEYVGTHAVHLPLQQQINIVSPVTSTSYLPTYISGAPTQAALDALPLTLQALEDKGNVAAAYAAAGFVNPITSEVPSGSSNYNAFDLSVKRRFTKGLQLQASWTWSHNISNSDAMVNSTALNPRRPQDFGNLASERADSLLDRRHRIVVTAVYDLPFFKSSSNFFLKNVAAGWQVAPTYTFESPQYVTVQSGVDSNLNGDAAGDRVIYNASGARGTGSNVSALCTSGLAAAIAGGSLPANATCGKSGVWAAGTADAGNSWTTDPYVVAYQAKDPNAMYVVAGPGALATLGRNTLPLPRTDNINLSASKTVRINERMNVQFTAQAFNLFNHAQFIAGNLYDVGVNNYLTSERSFTEPASSNFNQASKVFSGNPRTMLLSLKFNF